MAYKTRSGRRLSRQTKYNILATFILVAALIFITLNIILPNLVNIIGKAKSLTKHETQTNEPQVSDSSTLAPPVIYIPYEATNSARIDIKGFATANAKVRLYVDDDLKSDSDVESDGSFIARNIPLNLGTNSISGKSVDEKNKESLASKNIRLIYDNEEPILEVSEPQDNLTVKEKKVKISGKTDKNAQIYINDLQVIVNSEGGFQKDQLLNDGDNIITVKAIDSASNFTEITKKVIFQP
ncbi:MAG: hypothetical protein G01um101493_367 [Microgenomates group bacterium Gr01-1014_93]|nr:MAG: hypothetical protein G01um101493_367 [Microgenomates group bacterium Gr01-1014_93]